MPRIKVSVTGDEWNNRDEVMSAVSQCAGSDSLFFEINTEGPSLYALGIAQAIEQAIADIGIPPDRIWIDKWHNTVEEIPFNRAFNPRISHFFWMSDRYRHVIPDPATQSSVLALFIGRVTRERAVIMHELYHDYGDRVLMSLMRNHAVDRVFGTPSFQDWMPESAQSEFLQWWRDPPIVSITDHAVRDQYRADKNTNADLVRHYNRFSLEVVCETYCLGNTFFPTEKTVRPVAMGKPFVLFGPRNFLARLRELGFQTWQDFWDESYDQYEGPERWQRMRIVIRDLVDADWHLMNQKMQPVLSHNRQCLEDLIARHRPG